MCCWRRHPTADATQKQLDRLKALVELVPKRLSEAAAQHPQAALRHEAKRLRGDLDTIPRPSEGAHRALPNAQALADDLQHWLAHEPISARPDSRWYVASRFVRRHRAAVAATSVALLALVSLTIFSVLKPTVPSAPSPGRGTPPTIRRPAGLHARRLCRQAPPHRQARPARQHR